MFERFWLDHPDFKSKIKQWWHQTLMIRGMKMICIQAKLKHIKAHLWTWNQEVFTNIFKENIVLEEQLEGLHNAYINEEISQDSILVEKDLMKQWEEICLQEEIPWKQKSRV